MTKRDCRFMFVHGCEIVVYPCLFQDAIHRGEMIQRDIQKPGSLLSVTICQRGDTQISRGISLCAAIEQPLAGGQSQPTNVAEHV